MAGKYQLYPSYKSSGVEWVGDVPQTWEVMPLSVLCDFQQGKAHEPFIDDTGSFICVNARFVSTDGIARKYCTQNLTPARKDDILMVMSDLPNGRALAKAYFVADEAPYAVNQRVCRLSTKRASSRFLFYQLSRNPYFLRYNDGSNQTHLSNAAFTKFPALVPPLPEQTQIAAFLDHETAKIDALIAKQERLIALLEEKRQAVISHAVTKGLNPDAPLRPSGIDWLGDVPAHWDVSRLGFFTSKIGSGKTPRGGSEVYETDGILFLRSQNVYNDGLRISGDEATFISPSIHEEMQNTKVLGGDILLNITGGSIGRTCIVPAGLGEANVNQHVCIIRCNDPINRYLSTFLKADAIVTQVNLLQTGGNREGLNFEQIAKFVVCMPRQKDRATSI